jgi:hypothetical protein
MVVVSLAALETDNGVAEGLIKSNVRARKLSIHEVAAPGVVLGRIGELAASQEACPGDFAGRDKIEVGNRAGIGLSKLNQGLARNWLGLMDLGVWLTTPNPVE